VKQVNLLRKIRAIVVGTVIFLLMLNTVGLCMRRISTPMEDDVFFGQIQDKLANMDRVLLQVKEQSIPAAPLHGMEALRVKKTETVSPTEEETVERIVQAVAKEVELTVSAIAGDRSDHVALVNNTLVGLNETIEGLTVTLITRERVVFQDENGNRREVNVYGNLEKYGK